MGEGELMSGESGDGEGAEVWEEFEPLVWPDGGVEKEEVRE